MARQYFTEIILGFALGFMIFYPPAVGAAIFGLTLAAVLIGAALQLLDRKKSPQVAKLEEQIKELGSKVEKLILSRSR